jgi:hypothetical protein
MGASLSGKIMQLDPLSLHQVVKPSICGVETDENKVTPSASISCGELSPTIEGRELAPSC